jgi:cytochrome c oxidase subunit 2
MSHTRRQIAIAAVAGFIISASFSGLATARYLQANEAPQPHEIKMIARKFVFVPNSITVQKGELVRLVITSEDVDHGIAIKEFDVDQIIKAKQTKVVEFTADKEGKFEFFCSVFCGDGHPDMVGELIVTAGKPGKSTASDRQ